jgi:hypothetical protein
MIEAPPEQVLMQFTMGKFISRMITLVANLGVADHIDGPTPVDKLATATGANADALYRVMRALAAVGVFVEADDKKFTLTPVGACLRTDNPKSMRGMCRMLNEPWNWSAWGALDHSVKTGEPAFDHVHGMQAFEYMKSHPTESRLFGEAMTSLTTGVSMAVTNAYDFSAIKHLVDIGGSHGILLSTIFAKFPTVRGTLFDLPHVVEEAKAKLASNPNRDRIAMVGGSFFEPVPKADAYIMKSIIHDWDDASCVKILSNCRTAMEPGGRVLILEGLVTKGPESTFTKLLDIEMLVVTHGGRERTEAEFGALLHKAGLALTRVVRTESPFCVIEAHAG